MDGSEYIGDGEKTWWKGRDIIQILNEDAISCGCRPFVLKVFFCVRWEEHSAASVPVLVGMFDTHAHRSPCSLFSLWSRTFFRSFSLYSCFSFHFAITAFNFFRRSSSNFTHSMRHTSYSVRGVVVFFASCLVFVSLLAKVITNRILSQVIVTACCCYSYILLLDPAIRLYALGGFVWVSAGSCIFSVSTFPFLLYKRGNVMPICQTILNSKMIDERKRCARHPTRHILEHQTWRTQWRKWASCSTTFDIGPVLLIWSGCKVMRVTLENRIIISCIAGAGCSIADARNYVSAKRRYLRMKIKLLGKRKREECRIDDERWNTNGEQLLYDGCADINRTDNLKFV